MSLQEETLAEVLHSTQRVHGLTHNFYRYPARFSPEFVRFVVHQFSMPGDVILDPFMGGGTTIVEALAAGRRAVGIDINQLAGFVTRVKTTPLSERDIEALFSWSETVQSPDPIYQAGFNEEDPRIRNLPDAVRPFFAVAMAATTNLRFPRLRRFARCALLRIGQLTLDCKSSTPSVGELQTALRMQIREMAQGLEAFATAARDAQLPKNRITAWRRLLYGSISESNVRRNIGGLGERPRLVVTSPPYPGVHVLYHRWQVLGRRETPAPYWIADLRDGHGESYYTMGSRSNFGATTYFQRLFEVFSSLNGVLAPNALVVQLVSFSDIGTQLPLYLETLDRAGYDQMECPEGLHIAERTRTVPNRKWYAYVNQPNDASREMLLFHRARSR